MVHNRDLTRQDLYLVPALRFKQFAQTALVVVVGFFIAFKILTGKPKPDPKPILEPPAVRVDTQVVELGSRSLAIQTQGTVEAAIATRLSSEVMGQVLSLAPSFLEGGFFKQGDVLLTVDPTQYKLALARAESQLAAAAQRLAEERGRALQAEREWRDLGSAPANDLFLRKPQIASAEAALEAARVEVETAKINLAKTSVRAPFDGRIRTKQVDLGQYIGVGSPLADVYATDEVRVRLPLTDRQLSLLDIALLQSNGGHDSDSSVALSAEIAGQTWSWTGRLIGTSADVDLNARVHYAIVSVSDPFALGSGGERPPLTPGLFVTATLRGKAIDKVAVIPRDAIRTDGSVRWIDDQGLVRERSVELLQSDGTNAWVRGLPNGLEVVTDMPNSVLLGTKVVSSPESKSVAGG